MTCKDCLHYEACDRLADFYFGSGIAQIKAHICAKFSERSNRQSSKSKKQKEKIKWNSKKPQR